MTAQPRLIRRSEQEETGLIRVERGGSSRYVPAAPVVARPVLPAQTHHTMSIETLPSATQQVILHTSAVDRAHGELLRITPLSLVLAFLAVIVRVSAYEYPLFALGTLLIFGVTFAGCWLAGTTLSLVISPEFVSLFEAAGKIALLWREQTYRWDYYNRRRDDR